MSNVQLNTKISLLNKYIQVNFMKDHGKSTHDDELIKDILEAVVEDLKSFDKTKAKSQQYSLQPIINELKSLKAENSKSRSKMNYILEDIKSLLEDEGKGEDETSQSAGGGLDSIIRNLEGIEASQIK